MRNRKRAHGERVGKEHTSKAFDLHGAMHMAALPILKLVIHVLDTLHTRSVCVTTETRHFERETVA